MLFFGAQSDMIVWMKQSKLEKLATTPCPHCGHVGAPKIHLYINSPRRATCAECGGTVRTFITFVDFFMVGMILAILLFGLFAMRNIHYL